MKRNLPDRIGKILCYSFLFSILTVYAHCSKKPGTGTPPANNTPVADAGADQVITLPVNQVSLAGSGTDNDGSISSYAWTKVSGPAGETIAGPSSANTTVTGLVAGIYIFKLTVTDNKGATGSDDTRVTVNPAPGNIPPIANAGSDQTISLPASQVILSGSGTDNDGTISSYAWVKVSGPAGETIAAPSSANTTVTGLVAGIYVFKLTVTDNMGAIGSDEIQVTVNTPASSGNLDLFVSSQNTNSVKRYNGVTGAYMGNFVLPGSGGLIAPQEVAWGPDGHLYVTGFYTPYLMRYDSANGNYLGQFSSGYALDNPGKMTFAPDGKIYISQWGASKNKIARFNAATGTFIDEFPNFSFGQSNAMSHAWDAQGRLYVVCFASRDVKRFDTNGQFTDVFIPTGSGAGQLQGPVNLWFDSSNNLFIMDWQAGNVKKYNATTGAFVSVFISGLNNCEGFTFDKNGNLYIGNYNSSAVNKYDPTGNFISVFASGGGLNVVNSLTFGPPR
ncbi:MAG: hypothetical protein JNK14_15550 [Chitinophagaceae bacterium]|nr:hypothetical protein [Chitinophagaceae bacterium]